ncbi:replication factor C small subunit [Candidatus Woesearchaeota archaeon]|nr:replication factor C small subunit [Candidatus Woesearchaeota archaeon]
MNSQIWTEKFRPSSFEEVKGQEEIIKRIKALVETKNIPHMLFAGSPGTGKTTLALIVAKQLHKNNWKANFLELNASNDRGIDTVRNQVKDFAKTMAVEADAPKIILLDEADALTKEAQQALRRTMENYSNSCRFILSCNIPSKIIDPIKSRCAIFKFKKLEKKEIESIVREITEKERIKIDNETIELLYNHSGGDVRQLQNILQSCSALSKNITKNEITGFLKSIESKDIAESIKLALNKNFLDARKKILDAMLNNGLSGLDVVKEIQREVLNMQVDDEKKLNIIERCGEIEFRLVEGSDDFIQVEALLAFIAKK